MSSSLFFILSLLALAVVIRPFTVLVHELGHGIPALLLTRDKVTLYIGSYGDPSRSLRFHLGRLELFFKYLPTLWNRGLCVPHSKSISINQNIVIVASGPLISLLFFGTLCGCIILASKQHESIQTISIAWLIYIVYDFFSNIVPSKRPIKLYDGSIVYNDGQQLKELLQYKTLPPLAKEGIQLHGEAAYPEAAKTLQEAIEQGLKNDNIYRLAISAFYQCKDLESARKLFQKFEQNCKLTEDDFASAGMLQSQLGYHRESLADFQKALSLDPYHTNALSNRGYTYILLEDYEKAIIDFDKVIELEPQTAYAFSNRGLAKMKSGRQEEGLKDMEIALEMDNQDAYAHRNLGIYFFEKEDFMRAKEYFNYAQSLNPDTHLLDYYMSEIAERM